jgi:acetoin utilization deacetylase AcuC-like enzyme/GNAT superfamily N-acetyltransferase
VSLTGIAWSAAFAAYDRGPGAAFLPAQPGLPDDRWDSGDRVACMRDYLDLVPHPWRLVGDFDPIADAELLAFHEPDYLRRTGLLRPARSSVDGALVAAAAVHTLCRQVWRRELDNGYALVRPAGHHAEAGRDGGGCLLANGVLAVLEARRLGARRVLYVDWDAHHGNAQQTAFWRDPDVLTISIHQDRAYPPLTGGLDARGAGPGLGANLNVPVPMGSGGGVYRAVFEQVIEPAADRFAPDFVMVSSGLDGSYLDPSARLALHSGDYGWMAARMRRIAERHASGRLLLTHEGGYARSYLPLCFLRILEALSGFDSGVADPFLTRWGQDFAAAVPDQARRTIDHCAALVRGGTGAAPERDKDGRMQLRGFEGALAPVVSGWAPASAETSMWCGYAGAPVPADRIAAWAGEDGVRAYGLWDGTELVAYGELWVDDDEAEVELARLIVAPARRGVGVGRELVRALTALATAAYPDVFMRVHPDNAVALRCYRGAGFQRVPAELEAEWNAPQPVRYVWLRYEPDPRR